MTFLVCDAFVFEQFFYFLFSSGELANIKLFVICLQSLHALYF